MDTSPFPNPFKDKSAGLFLLCTECRSKAKGWSVISDVNRFGKRSRSALVNWKHRVRPSFETEPVCFICDCLRKENNEEHSPIGDANRKQAYYVNMTLFKVLLCSRDVQEMFIKELARRSSIPEVCCRTLLTSIPSTKLCRLHHNHTRHSMDYAMSQDTNRIGERQGLCVFTNNGCANTSSILRPLSKFGTSSIEDTEMYCEYVDAIESLSGGVLSMDHVSGKQAYATCRYVLTKGASGVRPIFQVSSSHDSADRCLVDCVLY